VKPFASLTFPRLLGRGSIEAANPNYPAADAGQFPRLLGRGSIEAENRVKVSSSIVEVSTSVRTWLH